MKIASTTTRLGRQALVRSVLAVGAACLSLGSVLAGAAAATDGPARDVSPTVLPDKHPTCNNDPGFDASNEPLCWAQHRHYHH